MKLTESISFRNLLRRPVRTGVLVGLVMFLALSVFGGTLVQASLSRGLTSLEERLGADVMVLPYEAATKSNVELENFIIQGSAGYSYMSSAVVDKVKEVEGVGQVSTQLFLSTLSAGCCSLPVQIIGFDPETDFTIQPWIRRSYHRDLQDGEVIVGNDLVAFVGDDLTFYDMTVHVAAKLDKTGTNLDTAVYCNMATIRGLIRSSLDKKLNTFADLDPDAVVSCVLVNAADGYNAEEVMQNIKVKQIKGTKTIQSRSMISGISDSLGGASNIITLLMAVVWLLAVVILILVFTLSINSRKKEFAILRVVGASRKKLAGIVLGEAVLTGLAGSLLGVLLGLCIILPFSGLLEEQLGLPFLLPGPAYMAVLALVSVAVSTLAGALTAALAAGRVSRIDPGLILREGN